MTRLVAVNQISDELLQQAVDVLKRGGVVAYPTDTAYGFAVDATNSKAVKRLYDLKGRDYSKPVSVIFPNIAQARRIVKFNQLAKKIANEYWPGGVTLVLPLRKALGHWKMLSAGSGTLGIRYPDSNITDRLVQGLGKPITATSANISGKPTCYSVSQIKRQYSRSKLKPDLYIDGGELKEGSISTMLHVEGRHVTLLREGVVSYDRLIKKILK